ncbi:MAG: hypothetical protein ACTH2Q_12060 [Propionibacteriaceae bacterium]
MPQSDLLLSWSGGKDCALALHTFRRDGTEPRALLTTVAEPEGRVSHHGTPAALLEQQAAATGIELITVAFPDPCPNDEYGRRMHAALTAPALAGLRQVAFGDLALADVRAWREERLAEADLTGSFPLWGRPTRAVAEEFLEVGFEAVVCMVDTSQLDASFVGRRYDAAFLADLPPDVDPAGENGEFHTFVTNGPIFTRPIRVEVTPQPEEGHFVRADLSPGRVP